MHHILSVITFIIVLGILIFIHELGHYILAKLSGVKVEKFSLGFGPRLLWYKLGETEYRISAVPLGGYVKLAGEEPDEGRSGASFELYSRPKYQQLGIFAAGPLMNIAATFLLLPLAYMLGVGVPGFTFEPPTVGEIKPNGIAAATGVKEGDRFIAINDKPIEDWEDFFVKVASNPGTSLEFEVLRGEKKLHFTMKPESDEYLGGGDIGVFPHRPAKVYDFVKGFPAEESGLQKGDVIRRINGVEINDWDEMTQELGEHEAEPLEIQVERNGQMLSYTITPRISNGRPMLGITATKMKKFPFTEAVTQSFEEIKKWIVLTYTVIGKLITFRLPLKTMGGPVQIYSVTDQAAQSGLSDVIFLMALISLQLGILNLLPFPPLDGGLILYLLVETVTRREVPIRVREWAQTIGFFLLISLMLAVTYYDFQRLF